MVTGNLVRASELMPTKIEKVFDQPKVFEIIKAIGDGPVKNQIEFELVTLASLMSVGGNLNRAQVPFIAAQLIDLYPNESIADFKICFQRGAIGAYGDIQRLDGITIGQWMKSYLDEKYEVLEAQLMKEKENIYKPVEKDPDYDPVKHQAWIDKLKEVCSVGNKVPEISDADIRRTGKEQPPLKRAHTAGWAEYEYRGIVVLAEDQEHAKRIVETALRHGLLEEDI